MAFAAPAAGGLGLQSNSGKLCNAHWQAWKNERISLPEEEPTSPINGIRRGERENCYIREASANDGFIECKVPAFGGVLSFPTRVLLPGQIDLSSVTEKSVSIFPCSASPKQDTQRAQREFAKLLVVGKQFDPSSVNIFTRSAYQDTQHAKRERVKQKIRRALQWAFHYCRPCNCLRQWHEEDLCTRTETVSIEEFKERFPVTHWRQGQLYYKAFTPRLPHGMH